MPALVGPHQSLGELTVEVGRAGEPCLREPWFASPSGDRGLVVPGQSLGHPPETPLARALRRCALRRPRTWETPRRAGVGDSGFVQPGLRQRHGAARRRSANAAVVAALADHAAATGRAVSNRDISPTARAPARRSASRCCISHSGWSNQPQIRSRWLVSLRTVPSAMPAADQTLGCFDASAGRRPPADLPFPHSPIATGCWCTQHGPSHTGCAPASQTLRR